MQLGAVVMYLHTFLMNCSSGPDSSFNYCFNYCSTSSGPYNSYNGLGYFRHVYDDDDW